MRLIDAESLKAMRFTQSLHDNEGRLFVPFTEVAEAIFNAPTIEAESVVHCIDCQYAETYVYCGEVCLSCTNNKGLDRDVPNDGYCYCGAKMDLEGE